MPTAFARRLAACKPCSRLWPISATAALAQLALASSDGRHPARSAFASGLGLALAAKPPLPSAAPDIWRGGNPMAPAKNRIPWVPPRLSLGHGQTMPPRCPWLVAPDMHRASSHTEFGPPLGVSKYPEPTRRSRSALPGGEWPRRRLSFPCSRCPSMLTARVVW